MERRKSVMYILTLTLLCLTLNYNRVWNMIEFMFYEFKRPSCRCQPIRIDLSYYLKFLNQFCQYQPIRKKISQNYFSILSRLIEKLCVSKFQLNQLKASFRTTFNFFINIVEKIWFKNGLTISLEFFELLAHNTIAYKTEFDSLFFFFHFIARMKRPKQSYSIKLRSARLTQSNLILLIQLLNSRTFASVTSFI